MTSDEVIDLIAEIEVQRQHVEKEAGLAAACSGALRRLQEFLDREKQAPEPGGPGAAGHPANIEAVQAEIERVKRLAGVAGHRPAPKDGRPPQGQEARKNSPRTPSRDRGRKSMGRRSGR